MTEFISELFAYGFLRRAILVGVLVSLCAALLGVTLVLKRYSMIGDGLSHVGFGALCVAMALNFTPLYVAVPVVIAAAFFLLRISENSRIRGDAAVALISSTAIAAGVIASSLTSGLNTDVSDYLFGSILAMGRTDVLVSALLSLTVLLVYLLFYHRIFAVTFDAGFAKAAGTQVEAYNTMIALLTAATVVVGMRMMGTMLISSLLIFPALTAMRVCKSYRGVALVSALLSVCCFCFGIALSFAFSTPAGASVVAVSACAFLLFSIIGAVSRRGK